MGVEFQESGGAVTFAVRVTPGAKRDAIEGEWQGAMRVRLTAQPVDDRANEALRRLLSGRLKIGISAVRIVAGERSRSKRIEIRGVRAAQILALMEA